MSHYYKSFYMNHNGDDLFTMILLPDGDGKFPLCMMRSPYESEMRYKNEEELRTFMENIYGVWANNGYGIVYQHCRGCGKSTGDSDAFVNEREDGKALLEYIRQQPYYNGEILLVGGSYCGFVNFSHAPYDDDIKGMIVEATDCNLYNFVYLNGIYRSRLHGDWYIDRYKTNGNINRSHDENNLFTLPMTEYSRAVFGEPSPSLDEMFMHPDKDDPFWQTDERYGPAARAVKEAKIPMFVTTGFNDIFCNGCYEMWESIDEELRNKCFFSVHPYAHSGSEEGQVRFFPDGTRYQMHEELKIKWADHVIRGTEPPMEPGVATYYELFANKWHSEPLPYPENELNFTLGDGKVTYKYDPKDPARYVGGLSNNFAGASYMDDPGQRQDIITCFTEPFTEDVHARGKMNVRLTVSSDCEDTAFYVRVGITKPEGDYALRDSITQISNFDKGYTPGDEIEISFELDYGAFLVEKGERLRIDVSSSAFPLFLPHTNNRGLFSVQTETKVATNTVDLSRSVLTIKYI